MPVPDDWTRIVADHFTFWLPPFLSEVSVRGIDSSVRRWESEDMIVQSDYGRYSDPLTSYASQKAYHVTDATVGGEMVRIVSFQREDGWRFTAIHFAEVGRDAEGQVTKLTVTVEASPLIDPELALQLVKNVRP